MFYFFYLDKKGDDWAITEKTVKIHSLQRLQKTGGGGVVLGESEGRSASCKDVVHGCLVLVQLMHKACLHPCTRQPSRPLSLLTSLLVDEGSLRGEGGGENLVGVRV